MVALNVAAVAHARTLRPDVVLSGHVAVSPAARAIKRLRRTPYVQYCHGKELVDRPALTRGSLRNADAVVAVSTHTCGLATELGAAGERLHLVPPGVDSPRPNRESRFARPTVVSVSRLGDRYKGHDMLVRAFPLVRARVPDVQLLVVGEGPLRPYYEALARSVGAGDAVSFLGPVEDDERDRLLEKAHVFALPARLRPGDAGEGFGIVFLEAGSHEVPVVAGARGGPLDVVVDGETGLLVDPEDHVAVAEALAHLLVHPEEARKMGHAGARRASSFTWEVTAARVEEILVGLAHAGS